MCTWNSAAQRGCTARVCCAHFDMGEGMLQPLVARAPGHPHAAAQAPGGGSNCPLTLGAMCSFL